MKELVFLLEEESAKAMLESLLPRILEEEIALRYMVFEGKQDLEKQMMKRMRGYINPQARFIVLRDQDSFPDCVVLKARLMEKCRLAGKEGVALVRIACRELESFYLADLAAVERGLGVAGLAISQERARFRNPDDLQSPSRELRALTNSTYQKVGGSREIGKHLDPNNERSRSFRNMLTGIDRMQRSLLA